MDASWSVGRSKHAPRWRRVIPAFSGMGSAVMAPIWEQLRIINSVSSTAGRWARSVQAGDISCVRGRKRRAQEEE